jgi:hypothetical protein
MDMEQAGELYQLSQQSDSGVCGLKIIKNQKIKIQ